MVYLTSRENTQISCAPCTLHSSICNELGNIMGLLYTFIHTWAAILCSTLRIRPSWPCPQFRLSSSHAYTCLPSYYVCSGPLSKMLFVLTIHISHALPTHNPPFTTGGLNTCATYYVQRTHIQFTTFLLVLLLDPWAGQLAQDCYVGNKSVASTACIRLTIICKFNLTKKGKVRLLELRFPQGADTNIRHTRPHVLANWVPEAKQQKPWYGLAQATWRVLLESPPPSHTPSCCVATEILCSSMKVSISWESDAKIKGSDEVSE